VAVVSWFLARLSEHSSQVALGSAIGTALLFVSGHLDAGATGSILAGCIATFCLPANG